MDTTNKSDTGGGNKLFLIILLMLTVFILVLLLLLALGIFPLGGKAKSSTGCGDDNPCTTDTLSASGACSHASVSGPMLSCSGPAGLCAVHTCSAGSCIADVIEDCCGNGDCELPEESIVSCPIDCGGSVTINDGDGYIEINGGDECDPSSGNIDGAECDCRENDCTDGEDNDNDGQTDCDDPDCNCVQTEDCPPCEDCGKYPNCEGECRTTDGVTGICQANTQTRTCDCGSTRQSCEDSLENKCNGDCPDSQECAYVPATSTTGALYSPARCECQPVETDCTAANAPACEGNCPNGQECESYTGATSGIPYCRCADIEVTCEDSYSMQCTGYCPENQQCLRTAWSTCQCMDLTCEDSVVPECGGECPDNYDCEYVVGGTCGCVLEESDCNDINGDTENECKPGLCDDETKDCLPTGNDCSCEVRCENLADFNACSDGWCPGDEVCVYYYDYAPNANPPGGDLVADPMVVAVDPCSCRSACADIEVVPGAYPACYEGYCAGGYCEYNQRTGECGCTDYPLL